MAAVCVWTTKGKRLLLSLSEAPRARPLSTQQPSVAGTDVCPEAALEGLHRTDQSGLTRGYSGLAQGTPPPKPCSVRLAGSARGPPHHTDPKLLQDCSSVLASAALGSLHRLALPTVTEGSPPRKPPVRLGRANTPISSMNPEAHRKQASGRRASGEESTLSLQGTAHGSASLWVRGTRTPVPRAGLPPGLGHLLVSAEASLVVVSVSELHCVPRSPQSGCGWNRRHRDTSRRVPRGAAVSLGRRVPWFPFPPQTCHLFTAILFGSVGKDGQSVALAKVPLCLKEGHRLSALHNRRQTTSGRGSQPPVWVAATRVPTQPGRRCCRLPGAVGSLCHGAGFMVKLTRQATAGRQVTG